MSIDAFRRQKPEIIAAFADLARRHGDEPVKIAADDGRDLSLRRRDGGVVIGVRIKSRWLIDRRHLGADRSRPDPPAGPVPGRQGLPPLSGGGRRQDGRSAGPLHRRPRRRRELEPADPRCRPLQDLFPDGQAGRAAALGGRRGMNEPMRGLELRLPETLTEKLAEAADAGPRTETGAIAAAATPWV